jgi:hypothetical protein
MSYRVRMSEIVEALAPGLAPGLDPGLDPSAAQIRNL